MNEVHRRKFWPTTILPSAVSKAVSAWMGRGRLRLWCTYVTSGNGIAERSHCSIKSIAARKQCTMAEETYWYNVTPKYGVSPVTALANAICRYRVRAKGIDVDDEEVCGPYVVGDPVWMKSPGSQCNTGFKRGWVTSLVSQQFVLVDGIPRHVRDLRPALETGH